MNFLNKVCTAQEYKKARNDYITLLNAYDNIYSLMIGKDDQDIQDKQSEIKFMLHDLAIRIKSWNNIFNGFSKESDVKHDMYDEFAT